MYIKQNTVYKDVENGEHLLLWIIYMHQLWTRKDGKNVDNREHLLLQGQGGADLSCWASHHYLMENDMDIYSNHK